METAQIRVLYRQFLFRIVDLELLSAEGDIAKLLGQFVSILVFISVVLALIALFTGSPAGPPELALIQTWSMQQFLISTTILVTGIFAVLSWESLLPDRRDLLVLAPLPVSTWVLFAAKVGAVASALAVTVLALNGLTSFAWPLMWIPQGGGLLTYLRSVLAYWLTMFAAGIFVFGSVLGIQAIAAQVLSRRIFLRVSSLLQIAAFALFLGMYFLEPHWAAPPALAAPEHQQALRFLPSYWFLGFFHVLNGSLHPALVSLARRAFLGFSIASLGAGMAFLMCYLRTLRKIVEEPDIAPAIRRLRWAPRVGNSKQSAVLWFSMRSLMRSRQHRAIVCFYLGVGFAIVILYMSTHLARKSLAESAANTFWRQPSIPLLAASVVMMCAAILGTRTAFSIPLDLKANWIFRIIPNLELRDALAGGRRSLLLLIVIPITTASLLLLVPIWDTRSALCHAALLGMLGVILVDACLLRFSKIPFTCSYLPGKSNVYLAVWTYVMLGIPLLDLSVRMEWRILHNPTYLWVVLGGFAVITAFLKWSTSLKANSPATEMQFEEVQLPVILPLNLHRDGVWISEETRQS